MQERFEAVKVFFKATKGNGLLVEQTARGIAFVHMYAAYEFAVKAIVRTAIDSLIAHKLQYEDLTPPLMALFLDSELKSLKDCARTRIWESRIRIFEKLFCGHPASTPNTTFPEDGSHFRGDQLQTIFDVFAIKRIPARRRTHLQRINEMVNNRNEVAHGMNSAADVGLQVYTIGGIRFNQSGKERLPPTDGCDREAVLRQKQTPKALVIRTWWLLLICSR